MPVLTTAVTLDMSELDNDALIDFVVNGEILSLISSEIVIESYSSEIGFLQRLSLTGTGFGSPDASGFPTTGTITGLAFGYSGYDPVVQLTGLNITTSALIAALNSTQPNALFDLLLGGDDDITGGEDAGVGDVLEGFGGNDTIRGGDGADLIRGGAGSDTIYGGTETGITSTVSRDALDGGEGNDTIFGEGGNDVILGGTGADVLNGGDGDDVIYDSGNGVIDVVTSVFISNPAYTGLADVRQVRIIDALAVDDDVDTLSGGTGNDIFTVGLGDVVDGGDGTDTANIILSRRNTAVVLDMSGDQALAMAAASGGSYTSVERFTVYGTNFDDVMLGSVGSDTFFGGLGSDQLSGSDGNDTIIGSSYVHNILLPDGTGGSDLDDGVADILSGGAGNDQIIGGAFDQIDGGDGTDTLSLSLFALGQGVNLDLTIGDRWATLAAASGGSITGMENITRLSLTRHDDVLRLTGSGNFYTEAGDDEFYGDDLVQFVGGGTGDDIIYTYGGNDRIWGGAGDDQIFGGDGNDVIEADLDNNNNLAPVAPGNDRLDGGAGNDTLRGGGGDDIIIGGQGGDVIDGGDGTDTVSYTGSGAGVQIGRFPNGADPITGDQAYIYGATGGDAQGDQLFSIERAIGSDHADQITGFENVDGGGGEDSIEGGYSADSLFGGTGDDTLRGMEGDDLLDGGEGMDTVEYSRVFVGAGDQPGVTVDLRIQGVAQATGQHGNDTLVSIEGVIGSFLVDILQGDDQANYIQGGNDGLGPGSGPYQGDQLFGHGGDDIIVGDGAATGTGYNPGDGNSRGYDLISGGDGNDIITAGNGEDVVNGDAGDDIIYGEWDSDTLNGGSGNDVIDGGTLNDRIDGGDGNDRLIGGSGADIIIGGAGIDTADYSSSLAGVTANLSTGSALNDGNGSFDTLLEVENLVGSAFNDQLTGNGLDNVLSGGAGTDTLSGNEGDDRLIGGAGNDTLIGGAGIDTVDYSSAAAGVTAQLNTGAASNDGDGGTDTFSGIENLTGSAFNDVLLGDGGSNVLRGGAGYDVLIGLAGNDVIHGGTGAANEMYGGLGDDTYVVEAVGDTIVEQAGEGIDLVQTNLARYRLSANVENMTYVGTAGFEGQGNEGGNVLRGGTQRDVLLGFGGNDILYGGAGVANELYGGTGDDYYVVEAGDTIVENENEGIDTVEARIDSFTLRANVENLIYAGTGDFTGIGNASNNVIQGGIGNDRLVGGAGNDTLIGGAGIDTVDYSSAAAGVTAQLNTGAASNDGDGGTDTFSGIENLTGSAFNDVLLGDGGSNVLRGGAGYDVLIGLAGNDVIHGGTGAANEMYGGLGDDTYIVEAVGDTIVEQAGEGIDLVQTNLARYRLSANVENMTYVGTAGFEGQGNADGNVLRGGTQRDVLLGFGGDDILYGGAGEANELYGGTGNDYYVLEVGDTIVENANEGIDSVEARLNVYSLGANIENLFFGGTGNFNGTGNSLNNLIVGGAGDDVLRGGGGSDQIQGGAGTDRLVLLGVQSNYIITAEGNGWRIVDQTPGRDGSILATSIEIVEFGDKTTLTLAPPAGAKADEDGPQVLPGAFDPVDKADEDGPQVQPGVSDLTLAKDGQDTPQVQPGSLDDDFLDLKPDTDSVGPQIQPGVFGDMADLDIGTLGYAGGMIGGGQGSSMLELLSGLSRSEHNPLFNDLEARLFQNPTTEPDLWT